MLEQTRDSIGLCIRCRGRLQTWPSQSCVACRKPLAGAELPPGYRCGACRKKPPPYDDLFCAWAYSDPITTVITGLKFRRLEYLGGQLGRQLAQQFVDPIAACDLVTAVPLHWIRRLQRGFDQGQGIAKGIAKATSLPWVGALRRRRATTAQSRLPRSARKSNLTAAFVCRSSRIVGRHVLLVDDVTTTGATLEAAASALKNGGAYRVTALVAAKTPDDS